MSYNIRYTDIELLKKVCDFQMDAFYGLGEKVATPDGNYVYLNRGCSILAVGHLDTVQSDRKAVYEDTGIFRSPQLDDRLGVYGILYGLISNFGVNYDILLTEGEEKGKSTAKYFQPPEGKKYNWMFELDRGGKDVVCYEYLTKELKEMLIKEGFEVGIGSNTDIRYLKHLGVLGFNVGVGYFDNHSTNSWADLKIFEDNLERTASFITKNQNTFLKYDPAAPKPTITTYYYRDAHPSSRYTYTDKVDKQVAATSDVRCSICFSPTCKGISKCEKCRMGYHRDYFVANFGHCMTCLTKEYGFDVADLLLLLDDDSFFNVGYIEEKLSVAKEQKLEKEIVVC